MTFYIECKTLVKKKIILPISAHVGAYLRQLKRKCEKVFRSGEDLSLRYRAAPSRQVVRLDALGQFQRFLQRLIEIALDDLALEPAAQEISPEELAKRRRVLRKAAGTPQFARQRAERIVDQACHSLGNIAVVPAHSFGVERVHPVAVVHDGPEGIAVEGAQIGDRRHGEVLHAF